ncbi:hypothetical protein CEXT_373691 [Caerostris extrusa]|uniref:Uncharacterized protein n=1 Tax=Caerostris extrusa TaxID=172846 RepID=A0AAV4U2C4_CAEEX|nr:hypothetical protein CEXT_373691 [Caerostris extrusa]
MSAYPFCARPTGLAVAIVSLKISLSTLNHLYDGPQNMTARTGNLILVFYGTTVMISSLLHILLQMATICVLDLINSTNEKDHQVEHDSVDWDRFNGMDSFSTERKGQ